MLGINNAPSLNIQRRLAQTQAGLTTSFERLSSGQRINSAKDDAAGLAISERMTAQLRGQNQALRNVNDGISVAQVAEGALTTTEDALQRIRVLAVQSANASNSPQDRAAMDTEVQQLVDEMLRVQDQTNFNGIKLLDGSYNGQSFQVGANPGDSVPVSIPKSLPPMDGDRTTTQVVSETVTIHHPGTSGVVAHGTPIPWPMLDPNKDFILSIQGVIVSGRVTANNAADATAQIVAAIRAADIPALEAVQYNPGDDFFNLVSTYNRMFIMGREQIGFEANGYSGVGEPAGPDTYETRDVVKTVTIPGSRPDVTTVEKANKTLAWVDLALERLGASRSYLGATQNRFASIANNLSINSENLGASRSRIMDTDYAAETATLSRNQILQQAGTAMLAQANSFPQTVLSLLPK